MDRGRRGRSAPAHREFGRGLLRPPSGPLGERPLSIPDNPLPLRPIPLRPIALSDLAARGVLVEPVRGKRRKRQAATGRGVRGRRGALEDPFHKESHHAKAGATDILCGGALSPIQCARYSHNHATAQKSGKFKPAVRAPDSSRNRQPTTSSSLDALAHWPVGDTMTRSLKTRGTTGRIKT